MTLCCTQYVGKSSGGIFKFLKMVHPNNKVINILFGIFVYILSTLYANILSDMLITLFHIARGIMTLDYCWMGYGHISFEIDRKGRYGCDMNYPHK